MKKLILLTGLILLPALIFSLEAVFAPNPVTALPGEGINFSIEVNESTPFRGYRLVLNYDEELFTYNSAASGALFAGQNVGWWHIDDEPGELTVECIIFGYGLYVTGPGTILNLNFTGNSAGNAVFEISEFVCYDVEGIIIPGCSGEEGYFILGSGFSYAALQVWLEGPYQDGVMTTSLASCLPLESPYSEDPVSLTELPADMVDWVLVELRSEPEGAAVSYASGILSNNGTVFTGELPLLIMENTAPGNYYLVVRHRNHLALMSSYAVPFNNSGNYSLCNLSRSTNIFGNGGYKLVDTHTCAMIAGDADGDGVVAPSDRNDHWRLQTGLSGYLSADFNLSSTVTPSDLNEFWRINTGLGTQLPSEERGSWERADLRDSVAICYEFGESEVFLEGGDLFYQVEILASASEAGTRLGTGMVLLNYNADAFGEFIFNWGEVVVQPLDLLQTGEYPLYSLIVQDNAASRLAVTFEYLAAEGYGNLLPVEGMPLMRIIFPVVSSGGSAGLNFQENLMQGQQYYDDNATTYYPVLASDTDNTLLDLNAVEQDLITDQSISVVNYPNPGNPATTFEFSSQKEFNFRIYNIKGQLVNEFIGIKPEDGLLSWDGSDRAGNVVSSGIYFYKIETESSFGQGKVTILK
ncbi:MAG: hypothetical protein APR54_06740 [Candidatus Cloacimonas sp. SDB]|nr:MAG: hypothetical protein APR54_06740 [Candidatus Cloacimonas sp. SDB]